MRTPHAVVLSDERAAQVADDLLLLQAQMLHAGMDYDQIRRGVALKIRQAYTHGALEQIQAIQKARR